MFFDRFDIAEAYYIFFVLYHNRGYTNRCREHEAIIPQLARIQFMPSPVLDKDTLSENGKVIFNRLVNKWERLSDKS